MKEGRKFFSALTVAFNCIQNKNVEKVFAISCFSKSFWMEWNYIRYRSGSEFLAAISLFRVYNNHPAVSDGAPDCSY